LHSPRGTPASSPRVATTSTNSPRRKPAPTSALSDFKGKDKVSQPGISTHESRTATNKAYLTNNRGSPADSKPDTELLTYRKEYLPPDYQHERIAATAAVRSRQDPLGISNAGPVRRANEPERRTVTRRHTSPQRYAISSKRSTDGSLSSKSDNDSRQKTMCPKEASSITTKQK
jgi:hypothetical protein